MDNARQERIHTLTSFILSRRTVGLFVLLLPLAASFNWPEDLMHRTNYLSCFYVAGRLVWEGRASEIYPDISATPFATAPLNRFAYELLPYLRPNDISA